MTRQLRFAAHGPPAEVLRLCEAEQTEPGPGMVRVRLTARPVHPADLLAISGQYGHRPALPAVPGLEGMGVIEALGPGVTGWARGARVMPLTEAGTWQQNVTVAAARLIAIPDSVGDETACQLLVNPFTAWVMLFEMLQAGAGDVVVQTAAGSAVGRCVIQLGRRHGIGLVNIVRRPQTASALAALGAENIVATSETDWTARLAALAGEVPRLALDAVSGPVGAKLAAALGENAKLISYGVLSLQPLIVDPRRLIFQNLALRGFWLSHWLAEAPPERIQAIAGEILAMMAAGELALPVAEKYDLADYAQAMAAAQAPGRTGKILLTG